MPRPSNKPCARCVRLMTPCPDHLGNTWDHYALKTRGSLNLSESQVQEIDQELAEYGLNRMLALDRDNGNKSQGLQASRIYKSRNTRAAEIFALKCHVRRNQAQCMRNAGHEGEHRF